MPHGSEMNDGLRLKVSPWSPERMAIRKIPMERFIVISGCSGGGKSTLLSELKRRGHAVVDEPGRRIIAEEMGSGGQALPWVDLAAFAERAT